MQCEITPMVDMRKGGIHTQNNIAILKIWKKANYKNQFIFYNQKDLQPF